MRGESGPGPLTDSKSNGMVHNPREREVSYKVGGRGRKFTKKNARWTINFLTTVEQETDSLSEKILKGFHCLVKFIVLSDAFVIVFNLRDLNPQVSV